MTYFFERGNLYKHDLNRDVAILPLDCFESSDGIVVKCRWYNIVSTPRFIDEETIHIKASQIFNWKIYGEFKV
jgi:hypothetical protein